MLWLNFESSLIEHLNKTENVELITDSKGLLENPRAKDWNESISMCVDDHSQRDKMESDSSWACLVAGPSRQASWTLEDLIKGDTTTSLSVTGCIKEEVIREMSFHWSYFTRTISDFSRDHILGIEAYKDINDNLEHLLKIFAGSCHKCPIFISSRVTEPMCGKSVERPQLGSHANVRHGQMRI